MKRVRHLVGLAAAAPSALALAVPATAIPTAASGRGKTVSQFHLTAHRTEPRASSCDGRSPFTMPLDHDLQAHGWYLYEGPDLCVGTIVASIFFGKTLCKTVSLGVGSGPIDHFRSDAYYSKRNVCGSAGFSTVTSFGVHQWFVRPDTAVLDSQYAGSKVATHYFPRLPLPGDRGTLRLRER